MLKGIECLTHSAIKISKQGKIIYFDPYNLKEEYKDADVIFITHSHYDHFSPEDIEKVRKDDSYIVVTSDLVDEVSKLGFNKEKVICVEPENKYEVYGLKFATTSAYNVDKKFHPKENGWVSYIVNIDGVKYYIAGDTDITKEGLEVKCDVAFVPVGGTYTMNFEEAAELVNKIKPKIAVPEHYGSVVGTMEDGKKFAELVDKEIETILLYKEMEYTYNILDEVYYWMLSKQKNIEVRLLKEKSEKIQIGDYITFNNQEQKGKYIKVRVIGKEIFNSTDDLLKAYDVNRMMPNHTQDELRDLLIKIYGDALVNGKLVAFSFEFISSDMDVE